MTDDTAPILHSIRIKLYPNHMKSRIKGAYIARTASNRTLSIEEVCTLAKNRGGYSGRIEEMTAHVRRYFDEAAYNLCDGFAIDTGYYSIQPSIGGTFDSPNEANDRAKHPVSFTMRLHASMTSLAQYIDVVVDSIVKTQGAIHTLIDAASAEENRTLTPGGVFTVRGYKIKLAGASPEVGLYFHPAPPEEPLAPGALIDTPSPAQTVRTVASEGVKARIADNRSTQLIGIVPPLAPGRYNVTVITHYSRGSLLLKTPRPITGEFTLTVSSEGVSSAKP